MTRSDTSASAAPLTPAARRRSLAAVTSGTVLEYYDWSIYATFAVYFAPLVFSSTDRTSALLQSAAVFAVGFLARPLGGVLLGRFADRSGRKPALMISVAIMTLCTILIAATPTYEQVGVLASLILLSARVLQGLAYGGEYGPVAAALREMAPPRRRSLYSSAFMIAAVVGQMSGFGVLLVLQTLLTDAQMAEFGWRIPFALAAVGALLVLWLRRGMAEMTAFEAARAQGRPRGGLRELFTTHRAGAVLGIILMAGATVSYYTYTVYLQKLAVNSFGFSISQASTAAIVSLAVFGLAIPLAGMLGDRIGAINVVILSFVACAVVAVPGYLLLGMVSFPGLILVACGLVVAPAFFVAVAQAVLTGMFPTHLRALGSGMTFSVPLAVFGGTVELVALTFKQFEIEIGHFVYLAVFAVVGLVAALLVRRRSWFGEMQSGPTTAHPPEEVAA